MAPVYMDLQVWDAVSLPGMALLSMVILLVLTITLLALCTSCQRQSFNLENTAAVERNQSTLVRVVNPIQPSEFTTPERDLTVLPEDLQLGPNENFKAWRSHTLERTAPTTVNGGMVTM